MRKCLGWAVLLAVMASQGRLFAQDENEVQEAPVVKSSIVVAVGSGEGDEGAPPLVQTFSLNLGGGGDVFSFGFGEGGATFASPLNFEGGLPGLPGLLNGANSDPTTLLNDRQIQRELEMVDTQLSELQTINRDFSTRQRDLMRSMAQVGNSDPKRMGEIQAAMDEMRKERVKKLDQMMLPHQRNRLAQIGHHMAMHRQGVADTLMDGPLAEELGLSDEQKERLKLKAEQIEAELKEELAKLRAKAKKDLLAELSPEQQSKLENILGDDFQYSDPDQRDAMRRLRERMNTRVRTP